jgi:aspartokinase/homoserine dehydrogenase 1
VGLTEVEANHPAARLAGTDNLYILTTLRYRAQPLVIQGPGAGAEITAQAMLGDLLALPGGLLGIARGMGGPISRCGYRYRR